MSAKKQTLKSLLGGSDGRVEIDPDIPTPLIQPTNVVGGQYSVAVRQTPRTNTSLQLASALQNISPVLKAYTDIQAEAGRKEALGITDPEEIFANLKKEDPTTFLNFKRRKAYRNVLYKQALNQTILPALSADSDSIIDQGIQTHGAEADEFAEKDIQPYLDNKWKEFSEKVGTYANEPAARALWLETTSQWRNQMITNYTKKIDEFNKTGHIQELGLQLNAVSTRVLDEATGLPTSSDFSTVPATLQQREELLKEANIDDPTERTKLMSTAVASQMEQLMLEGRYTDALSLGQAVRNTNINGKPVFKTASADAIVAVINKINNKIDDPNSGVKANERRGYISTAITVVEDIGGIESIEEMPESTRALFEDSLQALNPNLTQEQMDQALQGILDSPNAAIAYLNQLQQTAVEAGDRGLELYLQSKLGINEALTRAQESPPARILTDPETKKQALVDFEEWKRDNPLKTAKQWITSTGQPFRLFNELKTLDKDLSVGNYIFDNAEFKNSERLFDELLKAADAKLNVGYSKDSEVDSGTFFASYRGLLRNEIVEYAKEVAGQPDRDNLIRTFIQDRATALTATYEDAAEAVRRSGVILRRDLPQATIQMFTEAEKKTKTAGTKFKYKSLGESTGPRGVTRELIESDRTTAMQRNDVFQLGRSLIEFGYARWDPASHEALERSGLGVDDVRLFGSQTQLNNVVAEWRTVMMKERNLEELTAEEENIKDQYQDFGIVDLTDLQVFLSAQETFFVDND